MVIDCHIHLMPHPGETQAQAARRTLAAMDRLGIDKACVSLGDRLIVQPNATELREQNAWVASTVALAPDRFIGFVYCSPNHPELSLELIEEYAVRGGFRGIKLWVCQLADHAGNDAICRRAAQLGLPVLAHTWVKVTGNMPTESTPDHLVTLARRHPDVNFIMAHAGGDWERGLRTVRHVPHIYPDTCGNDPEAGFTELAVALVGAERLVFGSDATGRSFASQLAKVTGADITDDQKRLILGDNLERLMPA
ncbi:MAG: amidohydrolase [Armatimonadetes bacterium]|nr:amidohydrolase [Armatimonadota bacterium]